MGNVFRQVEAVEDDLQGFGVNVTALQSDKPFMAGVNGNLEC